MKDQAYEKLQQRLYLHVEKSFFFLFPTLMYHRVRVQGDYGNFGSPIIPGLLLADSFIVR